MLKSYFKLRDVEANYKLGIKNGLSSLRNKIEFGSLALF